MLKDKDRPREGESSGPLHPLSLEPEFSNGIESNIKREERQMSQCRKETINGPSAVKQTKFRGREPIIGKSQNNPM